jgi:hypothetical protein
MSRRCVDSLRSMRELHRFLRGMVAWVGYPQICVRYERQARVAGTTKYPLSRMIRLAWTAAVSFSPLPLRMSPEVPDAFPRRRPAATPTPVEEIAEAIDHIGPLHGLPFEDRLWLARHGQEVVANPGDILFEEGAPAEHMVLILKGEIHVRRQHGGPMALFIGRTGQMTGVLPFSRMKATAARDSPSRPSGRC